MMELFSVSYHMDSNSNYCSSSVIIVVAIVVIAVVVVHSSNSVVGVVEVVD